MSNMSDGKSFTEKMADLVMSHFEDQGTCMTIEIAVLFEEVKRLRAVRDGLLAQMEAT